MPTVTHNDQCFMIDGRTFWILGATVHYARVPEQAWAERIAAARQAGFNTIDTVCPWLVHEPRNGRFNFEGQHDVVRFIELCDEMGMKVVLRPGPYVGHGYDGGGIPGWVFGLDDVKIREANDVFLEKVSRYFRRLFNLLSEYQVSKKGPILLVQVEHAWLCSNHKQVRRYLQELARLLRESGVNVPLINSNDLWQEIPGTIDTWRGWDQLLAHLRQLHSVKPSVPRLVSEFNPAGTDCWGCPAPIEKSADAVLWNLTEVLASGSQLICNPFTGGTNFGFLGGQIPGPDGGGVTTRAATGAPLEEHGGRNDRYAALKRLVMFANHFSHVFAGLDPDHQPLAVDLTELAPPRLRDNDGSRAEGSTSGVSIVSQRGPQGRIAFAFSDGKTKSATLLLDNGLRMPIHFGTQPVGWYVFDADLSGAGRLQYSNVCPWAVIDRSIVVFFGPEKTPAVLSIGGSPMETTVPGGKKPVVVEHHNLVVVVCNHTQIDAAYHDGKQLYVGIDGFTSEGDPIPAEGFQRATVINGNGDVSTISVGPAGDKTSSTSTGKRRSNKVKTGTWKCATTGSYTSGVSPRYASLAGPETLTACGASQGYGWYRVQIKVSNAKKRMLHWPQANDRLHLFIDGEFIDVFGRGELAAHMPIESRFNKGEHMIVGMVDNLGRFDQGNDIAQLKGLFGHLYEIKPLKGVKADMVEAEVVSPFSLRGYVHQRPFGQPGDIHQYQWTFTHLKKSPILLHSEGAPISGTFVLNDIPLCYYSGLEGEQELRLLLHPYELDAFKRGKNELRFAPDSQDHEPLSVLADSITVYECVESLTEDATWAFAKWEPPTTTAFKKLTKTAMREVRGTPCWWRTTFTFGDDMPSHLWVDVNGLSKGQVYANGHNLGRFFTQTATHKAVGPQTQLYLPGSWLKDKGANELLIFDEHGFTPDKVSVLYERQ